MNYNNKRPARQNSTSFSAASAGTNSDGSGTTTPTLLLQQQPQTIASPHALQHQLSNSSTSSAAGIASGLAASTGADDAPVTLLPEISDIMRSFGDSDQPRMESVKLVEHILQQQLRGMFNEASLVAMRRKNSPCPTQADFEFLMRNHPVKIARMRKHLKDMKILKRFLSIRTGRPQDFMDDTEQQESEDELAIEVPELFDEERTRRLFRADRISQILTGQQYLEFNEARKTSFYCRHGEKIKNKFRRFLDLPPDLRIPTTTMNILAYFAHETIAVIVDYAILTRLNSENRVTEPYSRITSTGASPAMLHICPEVTQGRGMEVVRPISVQEIHEGMRRFRQMTSKKIGFYRSSCDADFRRSFLAI
ncbi:transcription initiation protein SPT3 homolog [Bactrocera oleae]|uniref:transcription initiation protein SPT3 homolog n=1 Tax=Bactrocera oleae TaxID=104688 RepID=UPI0006B79BAC|nr:transcription initiation protein SPT3 homolog [Bactrocera oleae]